MGAVVEAGGAVVQGIVDRNGHRNIREEESDGRRYFPRRENQKVPTIAELNLHSDCKSAVVLFVNNEKGKFEQKLAAAGVAQIPVQVTVQQGEE